MDYSKTPTETLKKIEALAMAEIAKGGSSTVMKARYGVLGAASAELARR
jgi:hypothetical protein